MKLVETSINRPVFISMVTLSMMVMGLISYIRLGVDLYPKVDPPTITVTTKYPGAGPKEIETLVSKPIEDAVLQIGAIDRIQSTSKEGLSLVVVQFKLEVDAKTAQTDVRDKVSRIRGDLPDDIKEPIIERFDFADRPVATFALTSDVAPLAALRILGKETVTPRLQRVDGVGEVDIFGGAEREVDIELDRQKLLLWKTTPTEVANAIKDANLNIPSGNIFEQPQNRAVRVLGEYQGVNEVAKTMVKTLPGGRTVTVGDLGIVKDTFKDRDSLARVNGKPVVLLEVKKQTDANTVKVVDDLRSELPYLNQQMPSGAKLDFVFDGAKTIRLTLSDVLETMAIAAVLAVVVVYFFLGSLQSTLITGLALPMTVIATFFALYIFGFTLNIMTLLGLTLAVGLILDDAIVVRENIWEKIEHGLSPREASLEGTREVFLAVLATSSTIVATFLPVTLIPGIVGRFFASFALTVCIGMVFSTFDALTMAPMLSTYLISRHDPNAKRNILLRAFDVLWDKCQKGYESLLVFSLRRPKTILLAGFLIFLSSIGLTKVMGFNFLPDKEGGEIQIDVQAPTGTTLQKTAAITQDMEDILQTMPEVALVNTRCGTTNDERNKASIYVRLVPYEQRSLSTTQTREKIRHDFSVLKARENLTLAIGAPGSGGTGRQISFVIQGPDVDVLRSLGDKTVALLKDKVKGALDPKSNLEGGQAEIQYHVNRDHLAAFALSTKDVGDFLRGVLEGDLAGKFRESDQEFDIRIKLSPEDRSQSAVIQDLAIPNRRQESVPLQNVTSVFNGEGPAEITRIDSSRAALIEADLAPGHALAATLGEIKTRVDKILPPGYRTDFQGNAKNLKDLGVGAVLALSLAGLFIYMIMASLYESIILPFAILLTLPLAVVGAFAAMVLTGKFMDIYSVIGVILLMGLVTKNAILLVDYVEQLRAQGKDRATALYEGSVRRLRPIVMTSLAMIAGMIPVAAGIGEINMERAGMGIVAIGGLVSSTFLSLIVIPCAYIYLDNFRVWSRRALGKDGSH